MTATNSAELHDDYVMTPVPLFARRPWWRIFSVWVGFIIVVGIMAVGGGLAAGMRPPELYAAILIGNILLGLLAAFSGYVAASSGKSFAQMVCDVFPGVSGRIVSMYAPATLVGWYSIECAIFGGMLGHILGFDDLSSRIAMAASAALFCITTYIGFRGLQWLSFVFVPLVLILGGYAFVFLLSVGPANFGFGTPITFEHGVGLVIGSWALGVVAAYPDLARFARSPAVAAWMGFLGILIFNSLNFVLGAAGAAISQQYDPSLILLAAGLPALALLFAITNIWTTNDANLYSASLGISRSTPIGRRSAVLICAAISVVIAFFNPASFAFFFVFLGLLGTTAPALGGVVLGSHIVKTSRPSAVAAWLGWVAGSCTSYFIAGLASVPAGFIVGFLVWYMVSRAASAQPPEQPSQQ